MSAADQPASASGVARQAGAIGIALIVSSALGFVLLGLIARWLGKDDNAAFLNVWGLVFGFGSVISAVEQEIARQATAAHLAGRRAPASVLQLAAFALVACAVALGVVTLLPAGRATLGHSAAVGMLAFVALGGFAGQFLSRGVFLGAGRTGAYIAVILAESALRVVLAAALVLGGITPSLPLAAACIVVGCLGWVPLVGRLLRAVDAHTGREAWRPVATRIGSLAGANALSSLVLTAFPTLVTGVLGGANGLANLFAVVTVSRVPLVLISPVQAMAVPLAVRALHAGRASDLLRLQTRLAAGAVAAAVVFAAGGWLLGPWAMTLFMGSKYADVPAPLVAWLVGTSAVMATALLQAAVFIALERYALLVWTWAAAVLAAIVCLVAVPGSPETRGTAAFVAASLMAFVTSGVLLQRAVRKRADVAV